MKNLPVPVFLRPLDEKDASMKVYLSDYQWTCSYYIHMPVRAHICGNCFSSSGVLLVSTSLEGKPEMEAPL